MTANHNYLWLAHGDNLNDLLVHIDDHMQNGMDAVRASMEPAT